MTDAEYSDMQAAPPWIPAAVKAAKQGNAKGLYKPPGYERCGYTVNYQVRVDGSVRWALSYRFDRGKNATVATWVTDWLPMERKRKTQLVVTPPVEPIRITSGGCSFYVRVFIDALGLPVPVPLEYQP